MISQKGVRVNRVNFCLWNICGDSADNIITARKAVFLIKKGMTDMGTEYANKHIGCTIHNCEHHCCCEDYCSLDKIEVGTHEADPTVCQCTDCLSFKMKQS